MAQNNPEMGASLGSKQSTINQRNNPIERTCSMFVPTCIDSRRCAPGFIVSAAKHEDVDDDDDDGASGQWLLFCGHAANRTCSI